MQYIKIKYLNHYKFAILFTNQGPSSVVPIRPRRTIVRIPTRKTCIPTVLQASPEHYISLLIKISILVYHIFYVKSNKKGGFAPPPLSLTTFVRFTPAGITRKVLGNPQRRPKTSKKDQRPNADKKDPQTHRPTGQPRPPAL